MTTRKSTGKRLRFEVFERDHFMCQYCGAQPPDVVLVADHANPVAAGGPTSLDNLITACETCNQGKSAKQLGHVPPRPDADLLYLRTQQEVAELRRYQAALAVLEAEIKTTVAALQDVWIEASGLDWMPADRIIRALLNRHGPSVAERAVRDVAPKVGTGYLGGKWPPYLYTVAKNIAAEDAEGVAV